MRRLVLLAVAALGACTVGPSYVAPPAPGLAAGGFDASTPATAALQEPPAEWWRLYDDPVLDGLVQQALRENLDLRLAAANLAEVQAVLDQARALRLPSTDLTGGGAVTQRGTGGNGVGLSSQKFVYNAGFNVSYEIDLFGRIRRAVEAAKSDVGAQAAARDFTRVTVAADTARAYADACAYAEAAAVARRSLGLIRQTYDITLVQQRAGAISDFEVLRAKALLDQTAASVPTFEAQRRAALYQLAVLTGRPPEQVSPGARACAMPPRLTRPLPVGEGAGLIRRRPDVREAERRLAGDTARIGVITANLYPTVTLGGSVAGASTNPGRIFNGSTLGYSFGPLISWTFPNVVNTRARIRQAEARASGSLASFDSTILNALSETEQALSTYAGELDRRASLLSARGNDAGALRIAQLRYTSGSANFLDLLDAQRTLVGDENALAASDERLAVDQVSVFRALGGGWQSAPDVPQLPLDSTRKPRPTRAQKGA